VHVELPNGGVTNEFIHLPFYRLLVRLSDTTNNTLFS
jgi:hypothetical protein